MISTSPLARRRRSRLQTLRGGAGPLAVLVVLVAVVVAGVLVVELHVRAARRAKAHSYAQARSVVAQYLTAWAAGDAAGIAAASDPVTATTASTTLTGLTRSLQVVTARYTPGAVHLAGPDAPGVPFHAAVVLRGLGDWTYDGALVLHRSHGRWGVQFTPESVHPQLHPGLTLRRSRALGRRGELVDAAGAPLRGQDGELDGNLLGSVGVLSAAQAAKAGPLFEAGDVGGRSGLERGLGDQLAGHPGGALVIADAAGRTVSTLLQVAKVDGHDVRLSLDLRVQRAAEAALAGLGALPGSLVAIDTGTGSVLGIANHPYNGFGRAIRGDYPPGSTFKVVTSTAALLAGRSPGDTVNCPSSVTLDGRTFGNAEKEELGSISFATAFAKSCNTAFINLERSLPAGAVEAAARLYGFAAAANPPAPLPLTSFGGSFPHPADAVEAAASAIGQARVVASPLQMASVAAAVAAGQWRQPYVTAAEPAHNPQHPLPAAVAGTLRSLMAGVVGYGTAAHSGLPAGTYGKTGTAEYGFASPPKTVAWFIGFRGRIAFACQVGGDGANGGFGADTAAPAVARFLAALG